MAGVAGVLPTPLDKVSLIKTSKDVTVVAWLMSDGGQDIRAKLNFGIAHKIVTINFVHLVENR